MKMRNYISFIYLLFVQMIYGKYRLGHDCTCDTPIPLDFRNKLAGSLVGMKYFPRCDERKEYVF